MIKNKIEMYKLYEQGEFGNKFPCWNSFEEYYYSGYLNNVSLRHKTLGISGFFVYDIPREEVLSNIKRLNIKPHEIHITGQDKGLVKIFQGEIMYHEGKVTLYWTQVDKDMRQALLLGGKHSEGLTATMILRHYLDQPSIENMRRLMRKYPSHVIEFSTFTKSVGELRWNSVFWEVRKY